METDGLSEDLAELLKDGVRVNINELGEEVLGAEEAQRHMDAYLRLPENRGREYDLGESFVNLCAVVDPSV